MDKNFFRHVAVRRGGNRNLLRLVGIVAFSTLSGTALAFAGAVVVAAVGIALGLIPVLLAVILAASTTKDPGLEAQPDATRTPALPAAPNEPPTKQAPAQAPESQQMPQTQDPGRSNVIDEDHREHVVRARVRIPIVLEPDFLIRPHVRPRLTIETDTTGATDPDEGERPAVNV